MGLQLGIVLAAALLVVIVQPVESKPSHQRARTEPSARISTIKHVARRIDTKRVARRGRAQRRLPTAVPLPPRPPLQRQPMVPAAPRLQAAQATPSAPAGPSPLHMVRNAPEELGQVPDHYFWLRPGLQAVQDPVDGQLVFFNDNGRIVGRASMPAGFSIGKVVAIDGEIRLLDPTGHRQVTITRNIDTAAIRSLAALPVMADAGRQVRIVRRGPDRLTLRDPRRGGARSLDVRSLTGHRLAQAYEVGSRSSEHRYVVSEEIIATSPSLKVRVFVRRFDRAGRVTGIAYVPLDDMEVVPHDFIAVTGSGALRVLVPAADGVKIREYRFFRLPRGARRPSEDELKRMGRAVREIAVASNVTGDATRFRHGGPPLNLTVKAPPITRDKILENARAYLTVNWTMRVENFMRSGVENRCDPRRSYYWQRPLRFTQQSIDKTFGPMPYRWGGGDTPASFKTRLEWGALAGDVCSCRNATLNYCLVADAAGVDCSGFVSQAWGIEKRGTAGLLDVADEVKNLDDLKPGDAFDWPQHHVRLFVGSPAGAELAFTVLEASTRRACEGVCERTYRPSELNRYQIIRYRGIGAERRAGR